MALAALGVRGDLGGLESRPQVLTLFQLRSERVLLSKQLLNPRLTLCPATLAPFEFLSKRSQFRGQGLDLCLGLSLGALYEYLRRLELRTQVLALL